MITATSLIRVKILLEILDRMIHEAETKEKAQLVIEIRREITDELTHFPGIGGTVDPDTRKGAHAPFLPCTIPQSFHTFSTPPGEFCRADARSEAA